jgi:arylsulfatase A-like enzyme
VSSGIDRRGFLKLASVAPFSLALLPLMRAYGPSWQQVKRRPNVLILVFDALSAYNMSLHGYSRETTPNISRLAERAVVYRNHYSAGNFTTPGTASLLTGVYPWTHRAIQFMGRVAPRFNRRNSFTIFDDCYRFAYTHNGLAFAVIRPLASQIDEFVPKEDLYLDKGPEFIRRALGRDEDIATVSWARGTRLDEDGYAYSLLLSHLLPSARVSSRPPGILEKYPLGLPGFEDTTTFLLETAVDWLADEVAHVPQPFFGYFHLLPPHAPYRTRIDFYERFKEDGYEAPVKPLDLFRSDDAGDELARRRAYDEFILYADAEFGRLYQALESSGVLENTWLVLTSDHGEMFERGFKGHGTPTLYQPEIRVPLMIFEPGRQVGVQIDAPSSSVDVLPTLAHVTGRAVPNWIEGRVLAPYAAVDDDRTVYALMAKNNNPLASIRVATAMAVQGQHKLHYHFGYKELGRGELTRLFDVRADPEELQDLAALDPSTMMRLLGDVKSKMAEADRPYMS